MSCPSTRSYPQDSHTRIALLLSAAMNCSSLIRNAQSQRKTLYLSPQLLLRSMGKAHQSQWLEWNRPQSFSFCHCLKSEFCLRQSSLIICHLGCSSIISIASTAITKSCKFIHLTNSEHQEMRIQKQDWPAGKVWSLKLISQGSIIGQQKMKYITEREVDLRQPKFSRRNFSHLNFKLPEETEEPENPQSLLQAVNTYKNNDEHSQQLLKRLNVLREQERKLEGRTAQNQSKLEFYKSIRQEVRLHRHQSELYRQELAREMQLTRSILANEREVQTLNLQQVRRKMYLERWDNYLQQRESSRGEMAATRLNFQAELGKKQAKSREVRQQEEQQRRIVGEFQERKKSAIRLASLQDRIRINSMNDSKVDELETLSHLESVLLSRQARSRIDSEETASILKSMVSYKNGSRSARHSNGCPSPLDIYLI